MDINFSIELSKLVEEINIQSYYIGEAFKRKDPDYVVVQTSIDDIDALTTPIDTTINEIAMRLLKRVKRFTWDKTDDSYDFNITPYYRIPEDHADKCGELLKKAVFDYIVTNCLIHWLSIVRPDNVQYVSQRLIPNEAAITRLIGMISNNVRRRATNLGGV